MSKESKEQTEMLWKEKQSVKLCNERSNNVNKDLAEVKALQTYQGKLLYNIAIRVRAEIPIEP
jgi:hypothetical protein